MSCAPSKSHAKYSGTSISTQRSPASRSNGKMSSAHGTGKSSPTKGMSHASGRIGAGVGGFKSGPISPRPKKIR